MSEAIPMPQLAQLAFCRADVPGASRVYCDGLGFARAGTKVLWGKGLAAIQGLGEDAACTISWLIGRQDFVQLEFFHHTLPLQKPLAAGWRPSDLGYVRFGVAVPELGATLANLAALGIGTLTEPVTRNGVRSVCIRDRDGIIVELMEDGPALPGGVRATHHPFTPAVVYATLSVTDLHAAARFFTEVAGLRPAADFHDQSSEALWGLEGARAERVCLQAGTGLVEVVQYTDPAPRPKREGYLLSDQGFLNIAFGHRDREAFDAMLARALSAGARANVLPAPGPGFRSTYIVDPLGNSIEMFGCPREFDPYLGFTPEPGFGPPRS